MEKTIESSFGWKGLTIIGAIVFMTLGFVYTFGGVSQMPLGIWVILLGIGVGLLIQPYRVTVTRDQCRAERIFRTYSTSLRKVQRIHLAPFVYSSPILFVHTDIGPFNPSIQRFANYDDLAKAIIEAAYLSSPDVQLGEDVIRRFGKPPYGIFDK